MVAPTSTAGSSSTTLTGSALIKALKSPQDPPVAGGPSKVDLASAAWSDTGLVVPRKADVIRDWILEAWSRVKPGPRNPIAQAKYHMLFVEVSRDCASPPSAPLTLLGSYIVSAASGDDDLGLEAAPSLRLLFGIDVGVKAEAWAEMLGKAVAALQGGTPWTTLRPAVEIVCDGLLASLPTSPNSKKIAQSLRAKLPAFAAAMYAHPDLEGVLGPVLPMLFFPLGTLQTVEPLKQLLGPLAPSTATTNLDAGELAPALAFVPRLFSAFIDATKQHQYTLYGKSDKAPADVVIADRTRAAVIPALGAILELLNGLEDRALDRPSSSSSAPALALALWTARLALWSRLLVWGGYLESDSRASALVEREARRASSALAMYGAAEVTATDEGLAGKILRTLEALERLDHTRSAIATDVVGWCLASPERCHAPAQALLASILRFHVLTHSLQGYFVLLGDAARGLFDPSLPSDTLDPLYALVATGPLTDATLHSEISAAVRAANLGGRRGSVWAAILRDIASRVRVGFETEAREAGGKRKRPSTSESGARLAAVLSRLAKFVLDAGALARAGDGDIEAAVEELTGAFGDELPTPPAAEGKKKRKSVSSDPAAELLAGARLRVARSAGLLHRDEVVVPRTALAEAAGMFILPELRLEAFRCLYTALALTSDASLIDPLLNILDGPAKRSWSGRDASVTDKSLAAASWTIAVESGLTVFECGSAAQLDSISATIIARAGTIEEDEGLSVRAAIARSLGSAETWELPNLRSALLRALVASAKEGNGFAVLASSPAAWLSKSARAELLVAAYEADKAAGPEVRASIRVWLARLAEADVLGPLVEAGTLKHLLKSGGESSSLEAATLELVRLAFAALVKGATRDPAPLISALGVLNKPFKAVDVRARATAAFFDAADPSSWSGELGAEAAKLADTARTSLSPLFAAALTAPAKHVRVLAARLSLARFEKLLGRTPDDAIRRLPSAVVRSNTASCEEVAAIALEFTALSSTPEATLAAYLVLRPSDAVFGTIVSRLSSEHYTAVLASLLPLLSSAQEGPLRATRILISAPVSGSGRALQAVLPSLLAALEHSAMSKDAPVLEETLRVISSLVEDRTGLLRPTDAAVLLSTLATLLLPSSKEGESESHPHLLPLALAPLLTLARHRADLLLLYLPIVVGALSSAMPLLQRARPGLRHKAPRPWWLASDPSSPTTKDEVASHAALVARTLVSLGTAKLSPVTGSTAPSVKTLAGPLAKHAPAILVAYARAASDPWASLSPGVRRELEPGLFAIADVVTAGGRADGRGREGEGVGVPFGLGEAHGEAEKEVWADLWKAWARKRYTGRG